jgi:hypothetical protein
MCCPRQTNGSLTIYLFQSPKILQNLLTLRKLSFMSLIPNKKNKKDNRPGGGGIGNTKPNQQNQKVKVNTKGLSRNTKLTGGSQRGS